MPKSDSSNPNGGPSFQAGRYRPNWLAALLCFSAGLFLLVALVTYDPAQSGFQTTSPTLKNPAGIWGANSVWAMLFTIGGSTWLAPVFLLWMSFVSVRNSKQLTGTRSLAMLIACISLAGLLAMLKPATWGSDWYPRGYGGWIGVAMYHRAVAEALGPFGSGLIFGTIYAGSLLFILMRDIGSEFERIVANFGAWRADRARRRAEAAEVRKKEKEAKQKQKSAAAAIAAAAPALAVGPTGKKTFVPRTAEDPLSKPAARPSEFTSAAETGRPAVVTAPLPVAEPLLTLKPGTARFATAESASSATPVSESTLSELKIIKPEMPKKAASAQLPAHDEGYQFPSTSLLKEAERNAFNNDDEHKRNMGDLVRILGEFSVEVTPGEVHVGPVITCYEVVPAAGVRVEKISGLDKNIALGMRAQSVRILAPIPGKAAVGIEIPNRQPVQVGLREIFESEDWSATKAELPIALGKDVSGSPLISDLTKMPHLLIAGATGSGKSVCINSIIASLVYRKKPRDLRLIMIDPKVVELKFFNSLPHMFLSVVTEPKKVPAALKWLLSEMEQRYQFFAKVGARNITGFNARRKSGKTEMPPAPEIQGSLAGVDPLESDDTPIPDHLPYIVAIIDELADLMMVAPAEIETSIARLAQLARAAGIHLIIATQRPSVNVITGVIKANLPSRIAFQVASQVDSRTILDTKGADTLIGRGDMLFSPPGTSRLVRAQGAFISDDEVQALVEFLKVNGPPQYAQAVQQQIDRAARDDDEDGGNEDPDLGDDEELYQQALDVLRSTRRASTSMLQRRLRIGYNRAARIMEIMEEKGIVGPENGSSPREILVDLESI
jgi:DNA segregation ATPase FtsK/SpoIIIE, S-DNA-T family